MGSTTAVVMVVMASYAPSTLFKNWGVTEIDGVRLKTFTVSYMALYLYGFLGFRMAHL